MPAHYSPGQGQNQPEGKLGYGDVIRACRHHDRNPTTPGGLQVDSVKANPYSRYHLELTGGGYHRFVKHFPTK